MLLLMGAGLGVWRLGPRAWKHVVLLYWQRQCMNYDSRSDVLLYEKDPAKAAALLGQPRTDYVPLSLYIRAHVSITQALYYPRILREFEVRTLMAFCPRDSAIIYMHERHTPAGKRRLVVVYTQPWDDSGCLWEWAVYDPALISQPKLLNNGQDLEGMKRGMMTGFYVPKRLGPGQSDPADATHFTIPCTSNGHLAATYDGRLTDEDKIEITLRGGAKR